MGTKKHHSATVKRRAPPAKAKTSTGRWSQRVTRNSNAMDLDTGVFTLRSAAAIARSLKQSAERSSRRKATPFQSAMSMLNFEINRAGKGLPASRRRVLNAAKDELRRLFHRSAAAKSPARTSRSTRKKRV